MAAYFLLFILFCSSQFSLSKANTVFKKHFLSGSSHTDIKDIIHRYRFCNYCKTAVNLINRHISSNSTFNIFRKPAITLCTQVINYAGYKGDIVCPGLVNIYGPVVLFILAKRSFSELSVCKRLNFCPSTRRELLKVDRLFTKWKNVTPRTLNGSRRREGSLGHRTKKIKESTKSDSIKILQVTDLHIDKKYKKGSATDCGLFLCCRKEYAGNGSAARFGEINCDIPPVTANIILDAIENVSPAPDFVIYTGDSPPHDSWQETAKGQSQRDRSVVNRLARKLRKFTIYPTIGNHETFPQNLYFQPKASFQKATKKFSKWWKKLFDIPVDQVNNIQYSGYYTVLVRPGLRILSFNTDYGMFCLRYISRIVEATSTTMSLGRVIQTYTENIAKTCVLKTVPWEKNDRKGTDKFRLLHNTDEAEKSVSSDPKVIIIGHIAPGDVSSATYTYGDFYTDLVIRYSDVIVLQLFGHTHLDQFELVSDIDNPVNVYGTVFISPAVTTYSGNNPAFRIYHLDPETLQLMDYDQYFLNLTAANEYGLKNVTLLYSAKQEYGLNDLSPESFYNLSERFQTDEELFRRYLHNTYVQNRVNIDCNLLCKLLTICEVKSASIRAVIRCILDI